MNPSLRKPFAPDPNFTSGYGAGSAEATLRLIATLPAPEGLADRIQASLISAPRKARVLIWPAALRPQAGWMRAAAAAAIVFVVAGGGWGVYSFVQVGQPAGAKAVPVHVGAPASGFSSAGAMRTPQTLNGPTVPALASPAKAVPDLVKTPAKATQTAHQRGNSGGKIKVAGSAAVASK
jgi:hypothetical protein